MSFGIKKGNRFLDLSRKARIGLKFINNVFQNRVLLTDYSLPITFPFSPTNDKAFNFGKILQIESVEEEDEECFFYVAKNRYSKCKVILNGVKKNGYDCNINFGIGSIAVYSKPLKELNLGGDIVIGTTEENLYDHADAVVAAALSDNNYTFPMHRNDKFYDGNNPAWENHVNKYIPGTGFQRNSAGVKKNVLVPWPSLSYVIESGFKEAGYSFAGSFRSMIESESAILYNNTEFNILNYLVHQKMTDEQETTGGSFGIPYDPLIFQEGYSNAIPNTDQLHIVLRVIHSFVPSAPIVYTLYIDIKVGATVIASDSVAYPQPGSGGGPFTETFEFDYTPSGGDVGEFFSAECQLQAASLPNTTTLAVNTIFEVYNKTTGLPINLTNHVPELTFGELLNRLSQLYNLVTVFNHINKTATINFVQDYFNQASVDYTKKKIPRLSEAESDHEKNFDVTPIYKLNYQYNGEDEMEENNFTPYDPLKLIGEFNGMGVVPAATAAGDFCYVKDIHVILQSYLDGTLRWRIYSDAYYDQIVGDEGDEIKVDLKPLFMRVTTVGLLHEFIVPVIKQVGNSAQYNQVEKTFSPRIMYWRGLCVSNTSDTYPLASATPYDSQFNTVGNEALTWDRFPGLIVNHFQRWINALSKKLSHYISYNFNYADFYNYVVTDKVRTDDCVFLIMESDITIPGSEDEKPGEHKLKLLRINVPEPTPPPPPELELYIISQDNSSDGVTCDGRVVLGATGGTAPYNFTMNGETNLDGVFDAVCPGTYTADVIDDLGQEDHITVIIT